MNINQTPILGAKLPMRRETLKAIEQARDNLISNLHNDRKGGSKMQTLGASNPHNNNKDKHRGNTRITGDTVERVLPPTEVLTIRVLMLLPAIQMTKPLPPQETLPTGFIMCPGRTGMRPLLIRGTHPALPVKCDNSSPHTDCDPSI
eukprot:TRINITY_DN3502_c0_g1_i1.p1 TRINITY_DN3502_c0_g1~~TRINITY_DN3502_c0_g1_i1.p1  ORF type:complete len:147 (-),score=24.26 TRINITY_DN3502_c0_g1_i1:479-919(-)